MLPNQKFEVIVCSGGGTKGLLTLGALDYYYKKGQYDPSYVKTYIATSVGALINVLLVCGYLPQEIFSEIYKIDDFSNIFRVNNIFDIKKNMGLMSLDKFIVKVDNLIEKKCGFVPTLLELYKLTGKNMIITSTNVTDTKCEYYSYETKPNIRCTLPVKFSCNLPGFFKRIKYEGKYMVDGALMDNFPLKYVDDGIKKMLAIVTTGINKTLLEEDYAEYMLRLITLSIHENTKLSCASVKDNTTLVKIEWGKTPLLAMKIDNTTKMTMFIYGYKIAEYKDTSKNLFIEGWDNI